jgi:hypothetical protein
LKNFLQLSLGGEEPLVLVDGGKKENILDDITSLKKWKWIGVVLEILES